MILTLADIGTIVGIAVVTGAIIRYMIKSQLSENREKLLDLLSEKFVSKDAYEVENKMVDFRLNQLEKGKNV